MGLHKAYIYLLVRSISPFKISLNLYVVRNHVEVHYLNF